MAEKHAKSGKRSGRQLPYLYQTRKTPLGEYRRIVYARPATNSPISSCAIYDVTPRKVESHDDRALHGAGSTTAAARRPRRPAALSGIRQLLQLSCCITRRRSRRSPAGVRRHAQVRPPPARRARRPPRSTGFIAAIDTHDDPRACATTRCSNCSIRADCVSRS